jgi:outer membrane biosynthesis protein TonB
MGKLLDVLGIDATIQPHLPQDIVDAEIFIIGLQSIYENSPESSKKDTLANTIAELVRLMMLEIQNIVTGVTPMPQPQTQPVQPTPQPPQQPQPQVQVPQPPQQVQPQTPPTPAPTRPTRPRPPKPPKPPKPSIPPTPPIDDHRQARLDALEDELNEIQEAIVVFDTDEPEYQELNNRIIEIQNEINTLTR